MHRPGTRPIATRGMLRAKFLTAGNITGALHAHWPPPEGTNMFTSPALNGKAQNGKLSAVAYGHKA